MTRYIFVNCIAAGPVNFKRPLTDPGQPKIKDAFMLLADDSRQMGLETIEEWPAANTENLIKYSVESGYGAIVVGHSVDYHHGHLRATMIQMGIDPQDGRVKTICTMLGLSGYVQKRNGRMGWPTFDEACDYFGITRAGEESSEDNARCLLRVFCGMQKIRQHPAEIKIWKASKK